MKVVFIADLHTKVNPKDNKILETHLSKLDPAAWLVVAGDITHNGLAEEYEEAFRLLSPWKNRCVLMPGNHDVDHPGSFHGLCWSAEAAARWAKFVDRMGAVGDLRVGDWVICALDSTNADPNPLELAQGELGEAELNRAREAIEKGHKAGLKVCIMLHHNPQENIRKNATNPITDIEDSFLDWAEKLIDAVQFREVTKKAELVLCGHTHIHAEERNIISLGDWRGSLDYFVLE